MTRLKDPSPATPQNTRTSRILDQHLDLNEATVEIMEMARGAFDWETIDVHLAALQELLDRHFATEEEGGYMSHLEGNALLATLAERLERAHGELRTQLALLRTRVAERKDRIALRSALLEWVDVLSKHEAAEKHLLAR